jgi:uncharacterized protein (TIGR02118 family)
MPGAAVIYRRDDAVAAGHPALRLRAGFNAMLEYNRAPELAGFGSELVGAFRVNQRCLRVASRPGVALVVPVYRAQLSPAEFDAHWRDVHAPLALAHHVGMCGYDQNTVLEALHPGSPGYDGIAVLRFPSAAALREGLFDSPDGQAAILADTRRFVNVRRLESALLSEFLPA